MSFKALGNAFCALGFLLVYAGLPIVLSITASLTATPGPLWKGAIEIGVAFASVTLALGLAYASIRCSLVDEHIIDVGGLTFVASSLLVRHDLIPWSPWAGGLIMCILSCLASWIVEGLRRSVQPADSDTPDRSVFTRFEANVASRLRSVVWSTVLGMVRGGVKGVMKVRAGGGSWEQAGAAEEATLPSCDFKDRTYSTGKQAKGAN
ncbi:hypothetical protein B0H16DRAFT_1556150 [Mycena metata]|uniref:Uncharacterized protein n=1 Tax=Mycena metata TaxID=1033252 RepID=A0AAD7N573_9AGAR|nr:hypothetical protein B0H16DRAFT_1556136 [Mycena metata]KAJ7747059.1 hypothetical protein B0H16DRAFT_1556150 [Mycena metata]